MGYVNCCVWVMCVENDKFVRGEMVMYYDLNSIILISKLGPLNQICKKSRLAVTLQKVTHVDILCLQ